MKYKVVVYAISKNEEKFVDKWLNSMKEADDVYVLDTGSTDNTVELLKKNGVHVVKKIIKPWRFDIARNESLKLVPDDTDICVCTDFDEVFEAGWRKKLEKNYIPNYRVSYTYNWHINKDGNPDVTFLLNQIHPRNHYKWVHPVHEVLECENDEKQIIINSIVLNHFPDETKSRASYLNLLELSVKEDPLDDRNMHYLGREYMYYGRWLDSINTLKQHLSLKKSKWDLERCASMRYIARCYLNLNNEEEALYWYKKALKECDYAREAYVELGILYYNQEKWLDSINIFLQCLKIKKKNLVYINEVFCWDSTIDDIMSINFYNIGLYDLSLFFINRALEKTKDKRVIDNKSIIEKKAQ